MSFRPDAQVAVQVLHENGGFSLTRDIKASNGQGYFASMQGFEEQVPLEKFDEDAILGFRRRNFELLASDIRTLIGGWLHEGVVHLDLSKAFDSLEEAIEFARENAQIAIWDGVNGREVPVDHTASIYDIAVTKMRAMFRHPIFSPYMAEDDHANVEGEQIEESKGFQGILPWEQFTPVFPPGQAFNVAAAMDDFSQVREDPVVYKWLWNESDGTLIWAPEDEDGNPTHEATSLRIWGRRLTQQDVLGFAVEENGQLELESYNNSPPKALQDVKAELLKIDPSKQVALPEDHAEPEAFSGPAPGTLARATHNDRVDQHRRSEAVLWAQRTFGDGIAPLELRKISLGRYSAYGLAIKEAADGADHEGAMVALYVSPALADKIKVKGGEPADDLHITLAYFEDKGADRTDWNEAIEISKKIAADHGPFKGKISGAGIFHGEDSDVLWAAPSLPGLDHFRSDLVEAFDAAGFKVSDTHGYQPHITLKYDFSGTLPRMEDHSLSFSAAYFVVAGEKTKIKFGS